MKSILLLLLTNNTSFPIQFFHHSSTSIYALCPLNLEIIQFIIMKSIFLANCPLYIFYVENCLPYSTPGKKVKQKRSDWGKNFR